MSPVLDESVCGKCPHLVVAGVACDWRPTDECPYKQWQKLNPGTSIRHQVPFAIESETDAIRSID